MKEPLDHLLRPRLPWRPFIEGAITECGYDALKVNTITREQYQQRRKELGRQRCAMMTCMTCTQTAERWASWEDDPRKAVGREVEWEANTWAKDRGHRFKHELLAIAALISAHPEEFAKLVNDLDTRHDWLAKKAAR